MYHGIATLSNGTRIEADGTIQELANWADNIVRAYGGAIQIDIREVEP